MDLARLRQRLANAIASIPGTHQEINEICLYLGVPLSEGSKAERLRAIPSLLSDEDLPNAAEKLLSHQSLSRLQRHQIEEILWSVGPVTQISTRCRREVAEALDEERIYQDANAFDRLLDQLWNLDSSDAFSFTRPSLRQDIDRHVHLNPDDWTRIYLFQRLGAFECSDRRFQLFLEGLVGPSVRPNEPDQRKVVLRLNEVLRPHGLVLSETGLDGGYPVFSLVQFGKGVSGTPRNLIYATCEKPDLRLYDLPNNDIECLRNANILDFRKPIPMNGLRWRDIQLQWEEDTGKAGKEAERDLYKRLLRSIPSNSEPQRLLFSSFFRIFPDFRERPALLPEVWLRYDPRTIAQRGDCAFPLQRVDFMFYFSHELRVIIEVDGAHHYSEGGRPSPAQYAKFAAADRDLRLRGYELYRFGAAELTPGDVERVAADFFHRLFERHQVTPLKAST